MTDLDLLDTAVRMIKRDGPWSVFDLGFEPGSAPMVRPSWFGGVFFHLEQRFGRVGRFVVHSDTIDAIRRVYSKLQQ